MATVLFIGLVWGYFWYLPYRNRQHAAKKLAQYRKAEAVVLDKWISMPSGVRPWTAPNLVRFLNFEGGSSAPCNLKYEFRDFRGEKIVHTTLMEEPLEDWRALNPGDKIEICYSPEKMEESYPVEYLQRIKNHTVNQNFYILVAITALLVLANNYW